MRGFLLYSPLLLIMRNSKNEGPNLLYYDIIIIVLVYNKKKVLYVKKYSVRHVSSEAGKFLRYLGPGILITVGFIDPGNWAANIAAGSGFGYSLLWMVTLSTIMLVFLQHNVAHLGIVTGLCLAEAATTYLPLFLSRLLLLTAVAASIATALAEILGAALAISMLTGMPVIPAALLTAAFCFMLLWTNSYKKLERVIIAFVSLIGLSFLMELFLVPISWTEAVKGSFVPTFPTGSVPVIMSVLGAVVMPHNLFLHSEIIQSRQWNLEDEAIIKRQLNYEFLDTLFSMVIGWAINSAMIIIAAALFFSTRSDVTEIAQAQIMLEPMLGKGAALLFAVALFLPELRLLRRPAWPAVQSTRESSGKRIILRIIIRGTV